MSDMPPDEELCGQPCDVERACDECVVYWQRMRDAGYWKNGTGWTASGMREMMK